MRRSTLSQRRTYKALAHAQAKLYHKMHELDERDDTWDAELFKYCNNLNNRVYKLEQTRTISGLRIP